MTGSGPRRCSHGTVTFRLQCRQANSIRLSLNQMNDFPHVHRSSFGPSDPATRASSGLDPTAPCHVFAVGAGRRVREPDDVGARDCCESDRWPLWLNRDN